MGKKSKAKKKKAVEEIVDDGTTTIVGFGEHVHPDLVAQLTQLLEDAKTGNLTSFTAVVLRDGIIDYETYFGQLSALDMISALELLKQSIILPLTIPQYEEGTVEYEDE